jgi:hypothetical protein
MKKPGIPDEATSTALRLGAWRSFGIAFPHGQ